MMKPDAARCTIIILLSQENPLCSFVMVVDICLHK